VSIGVGEEEDERGVHYPGKREERKKKGGVAPQHGRRWSVRRLQPKGKFVRPRAAEKEEPSCASPVVWGGKRRGPGEKGLLGMKISDNRGLHTSLEFSIPRKKKKGSWPGLLDVSWEGEWRQEVIWFPKEKRERGLSFRNEPRFCLPMLSKVWFRWIKKKRISSGDFIPREKKVGVYVPVARRKSRKYGRLLGCFASILKSGCADKGKL